MHRTHALYTILDIRSLVKAASRFNCITPAIIDGHSRLAYNSAANRIRGSAGIGRQA